jgi:hypothetical protein
MRNSCRGDKGNCSLDGSRDWRLEMAHLVEFEVSFGQIAVFTSSLN